MEIVAFEETIKWNEIYWSTIENRTISNFWESFSPKEHMYVPCSMCDKDVLVPILIEHKNSKSIAKLGVTNDSISWYYAPYYNHFDLKFDNADIFKLLKHRECFEKWKVFPI